MVNCKFGPIGCEYPKCDCVQAEPVAWADPDDFEQDRDWVVVKVAHQFAGVPEGFIPLFAAPVAQAEPMEMALTDEQINKLWHEPVIPSRIGWIDFETVARAVELAHGIGASTGGKP